MGYGRISIDTLSRASEGYSDDVVRMSLSYGTGFLGAFLGILTGIFRGVVLDHCVYRANA